MGENHLKGDEGGRQKGRAGRRKRKEREKFHQSIKIHCGLNVKDGNI